MMNAEFWLEFAALWGLIAMSGFMAGSETALTAASRARMHNLESSGNKSAAIVNRLREKKELMIGALLFGNTLINISAGALATSVTIEAFGEHYIVLATVVVTMLTVVFAEVMPKTYALMHSDKMALVIARPVAIIVALFSPITQTVAKVVQVIFHILRVDRGAHSAEAQEEELRGAIDLLGAEEKVSEEGQAKKAMLRSILDLAGVKVERIMIHRKNVRTINIDLPAGKVIDEVLHSAFTRLPVWKGTPDNIVGVIHTKLLLQEIRNCNGDVAAVEINKAMMDPWFIPDTTTLFDQLQAFRARREHFAIIVDEYGVLDGVITLEDILEEIVGQIDDEHDTAVTGVRPQPDGSFVIEGKVTIRDLNREMDWGLPDEDYATIAGLLLYESQRVPLVGQTYTFYDFRFEILKKQRNQISLLRVVPPRMQSVQGEAAREAVH